MTRVLELWPLLKECVEKESRLDNGWTNILAEPRYHCHFHLPKTDEYMNRKQEKGWKNRLSQTSQT